MSGAVPSINYIGRQLGVSYIGRQCTEKLSIYQNLTSDISRPTHRLPKYVNYTTNIFRENRVWARKRSFPSFLFGLWRPCICVDFNFRNQKTKSEYNETTWNNISKHEYWYIFKPAWPHSWNCVLLRCCRKYCILYPKRVYGGGG